MMQPRSQILGVAGPCDHTRDQWIKTTAKNLGSPKSWNFRVRFKRCADLENISNFVNRDFRRGKATPLGRFRGNLPSECLRSGIEDENASLCHRIASELDQGQSVRKFSLDLLEFPVASGYNLEILKCI
mmetsp:Transcript_11220/g.35750  ORF Transcript_11220/g.35750 Transcript_11220/m.35750 type:complete len:129 (+) Transcript_11220:371-757(+)